MKKLVIIGIGGMGRETAWLVERINKTEKIWDILGFLDDNDEALGKTVNGYKVLGKTDDVLKYKDAYFVCAIGKPRVREGVVEKIKSINPDIKFATLIDPTVQISDYVKIGEGTIVCANSLITVNITLGSHVIVNNNCIISHDSVIKDYAILYTAVNVSGNANIGRGCELGTGMQVIQGKTVGDYSFVGAGAVVTNNIPSCCTAVGVPAKPIKFF